MLCLLSGDANVPLAAAIADRLGITLAPRLLERFPDGEVHIEIQADVRGADTYLIQPTSLPVGENLLELALFADACRRAGAARLTAVIPYFGYARQDRRVHDGEPLGAAVLAALIAAAGIERVLAVDLHAAAIEACFTALAHLTAVPLLTEALRAHADAHAVVVSPDLGAAKLAERYAAALCLPVAVVHKTRLSGTEVAVRRLVGDVRGLRPIIIDDMISTGGTIAAAVKALVDAGCIPEVTVAATHALLVGPARDRFATLPIKRLIVTDSVATAPDAGVPVSTVSLAPLLAEAIGRLAGEQSLRDLVAPG